jgi:2'-5' RNA ligase
MTHHIEKINDVLGNKYYTIKIDANLVDPYLEKLREVEPDHEVFIANQQKRDRDKYHITVLSVPEISALNVAEVSTVALDEYLLGLEVKDLIIDGIGSATNDRGFKTYYIAVSSVTLNSIRSKFAELEPKDFHITIGFNPKDVFGVRKLANLELA